MTQKFSAIPIKEFFSLLFLIITHLPTAKRVLSTYLILIKRAKATCRDCVEYTIQEFVEPPCYFYGHIEQTNHGLGIVSNEDIEKGHKVICSPVIFLSNQRWKKIDQRAIISPT